MILEVMCDSTHATDQNHPELLVNDDVKCLYKRVYV